MPFQAKSFDEVPKNRDGELVPDVQIIFHGQLILRSDGQECLVAVNPIATNHVLSIEARIKKCGQTDRIAMRHLGPLNFRNSEGLLMEIRGGNPVPAAYKLVGNGALDRAKPDSVREDDFRWILNVEGSLFHNRELNAPIFASQNTIRLRGGEYYFKTAARASLRYEYHRSGGQQDDLVIGAIGAVASASVFLGEDQRLVMKWQDGTRETDRTLSLEKAADTRYEIYIENTPLFLDPPLEQDLENLDEFKEYYKVLPLPQGTDRFAFVPKLRQGGQLGTPDVPCQVITMDGPGGS